MKDERVYLRHILRCIQRIEEYTLEGRDAFFASALVQDAVIRNLQTLAESSRRLRESATRPPGNHAVGFGPTSTKRSTSLCGPASPRAEDPNTRTRVTPWRRAAARICSRFDWTKSTIGVASPLASQAGASSSMVLSACPHS